jgi:hypothetical protein
MKYSYDAFSDLKIEELPSFGYFKMRKINKISNVLTKSGCTLFDVQFSEGEMIAKQVIKTTMFHIQTQENLPKFTLDKEGVFEYLLHFAGYKDIEIKNHPDFNKRFYLSGKNQEKIRAFFTDELILFLESNKQYHIEATNTGLLILSKERLASVNEIKALAYFGAGLQKIIETC